MRGVCRETARLMLCEQEQDMHCSRMQARAPPPQGSKQTPLKGMGIVDNALMHDVSDITGVCLRSREVFPGVSLGVLVFPVTFAA